jgi:hypothetical protein
MPLGRDLDAFFYPISSILQTEGHVNHKIPVFRGEGAEEAREVKK